MSRRDVYRAMRNPITPKVIEQRDIEEMRAYLSDTVFALLSAPKPPYTVTCRGLLHGVWVEGVVVL